MEAALFLGGTAGWVERREIRVRQPCGPHPVPIPLSCMTLEKSLSLGGLHFPICKMGPSLLPGYNGYEDKKPGHTWSILFPGLCLQALPSCQQLARFVSSGQETGVAVWILVDRRLLWASLSHCCWPLHLQLPGHLLQIKQHLFLPPGVLQGV